MGCCARAKRVQVAPATAATTTANDPESRQDESGGKRWHPALAWQVALSTLGAVCALVSILVATTVAVGARSPQVPSSTAGWSLSLPPSSPLPSPTAPLLAPSGCALSTATDAPFYCSLEQSSCMGSLLLAAANGTELTTPEDALAVQQRGGAFSDALAVVLTGATCRPMTGGPAALELTDFMASVIAGLVFAGFTLGPGLVYRLIVRDRGVVAYVIRFLAVFAHVSWMIVVKSVAVTAQSACYDCLAQTTCNASVAGSAASCNVTLPPLLIAGVVLAALGAFFHAFGLLIGTRAAFGNASTEKKKAHGSGRCCCCCCCCHPMCMWPLAVIFAAVLGCFAATFVACTWSQYRDVLGGVLSESFWTDTVIVSAVATTLFTLIAVVLVPFRALQLCRRKH